MKVLGWCLSVKFWLVLILFFNEPLFAKELKTIGTLYEIKETDILQVIEEKLTKLQETGDLKKMEEEMMEITKAYVKHPKPVRNLTKTKEPRHFEHDPTVVVKDDLKDTKGNIFYRKGARINPLKVFSLTKPLVFINGDDKEQLNWALKLEEKNNQEAILILVQGPVFELMNTLKRPLYFDQGGWLVHKLGIQQVPAVVSQEGEHLRIEEVKLD